MMGTTVFGQIAEAMQAGKSDNGMIGISMQPGGGSGYLSSFLSVLPVALPVAKTTSYSTNRTSEKPKDMRNGCINLF